MGFEFCVGHKTPLGQYFASILVETSVNALPQTEKIVGVDLGLKPFLVTSDNQEIENPRYFRESQAQLKTAQRRLSGNSSGNIAIAVDKPAKMPSNQRPLSIPKVKTPATHMMDPTMANICTS